MAPGFSLVLLLLSALLAICGADTLLDFTVPIARPHIVVGARNLGFPLPASNPRTRASLQYFTPDQLRPIYGIQNSNTLGAGKTIAIIDAYGASTAFADLTVFSQNFKLPLPTEANFKKVNQTGGTTYPPDDTAGSWGMETALDVQSVHAFAPGANILLVVCNSADLNDLFAGVKYAVQHADYISMSFGGGEGSYISYFEPTFAAATTKSFFASTGDSGSAGGISYPSSSKYVVAVGGTSIYSNADYTLSSEKGWTGSGGGCSAFTAAIPSQVSAAGYSALGCRGKKALPDLSMLADPNSGLMIYWSEPTATNNCVAPNCYSIAGGTSLAAPLAAARAAIRGVQITPDSVYTSTIAFRDITAGDNGGHACGNGLDLVTGRGTWVGPS